MILEENAINENGHNSGSSFSLSNIDSDTTNKDRNLVNNSDHFANGDSDLSLI